jgi:hypothetical protein
VRREDRALTRLFERLVDRGGARDLAARQLERGERTVAFVQVNDGRLDAQRGECADAANPEQGVLRKPRDGVAHVELGRDPALEAAVLRSVGVEQEEPCASHGHAPDLCRDLLPLDGDRDRERS